MTYALTAELALKTTIKDYHGVTFLEIKGSPSKENITSAMQYYDYCKSIARSIEKGTEKPVSLSFNSKSDGSGETLDFSSSKAAKDSLEIMMHSETDCAYAVYLY